MALLQSTFLATDSDQIVQRHIPYCVYYMDYPDERSNIRQYAGAVRGFFHV